MKKVLLKKALAAVLAATTILSVTPVGVSATWTKDNYGNWSWTEGASRAIGWKSIDGNWYYFDFYGKLKTGWINDWGAWYYSDANGIMQTGIIEIDGRTYAFGDNGIMQTGKISINGQTYEFNQYGVGLEDKMPKPNKRFDVNNNSLSGAYKPPYADNGKEWGAISEDSHTDEIDEIFDNAKEIKIRYKVTFDCNGGSNVSPITGIKPGKTIDLPDEPKRSGYEFDGWYKDDDFDKEFDEDTKVKSDTKLYAKWIKEGSDSGSGEGDKDSESDNAQLSRVNATVSTNDAGISSIKVTTKASDYAAQAKAKVELINKVTGMPIEDRTQNIGIGSNGIISCTFGNVTEGTYIVKVTVGKAIMNSAEFKILSKTDIANSDIEKAAQALNLGDISLVTSDLKLPTTGAYGTKITWTAHNVDEGLSDQAIIIKENSTDSNSVVGKVNRPDGTGDNVRVKLTATISKENSTSATREFVAYVKKFNKELGNSVKDINKAVSAGSSDEEKILGVKNKITTSSMVAIGISEAQYTKYEELQLSDTQNQTYQLAVAKAVYDDIKAKKYISGNSDENVYKKELEKEAIGIINVFNREVTTQSRLKQDKEDDIKKAHDLAKAHKELKQLIDEQYSDGNLRKTLIVKENENTKESWNKYSVALNNAIDFENNDEALLPSVQGAIEYLKSSKQALTGAYLGTINIYKNGETDDCKWTDYRGEISFQKGEGKAIIAEHGGASAYRAALTTGTYKVLVDGKNIGKTINISDKSVEDNLYFYTVKFAMSPSDAVTGKITAKYGNTVQGYSDVKSQDAVLSIPNNELILEMFAESPVTKEFSYKWTSTGGTYNSSDARYSISNFVKGKVDVVCEVTPNELLINNIKGVAADNNSGNVTVTAKVYQYKNENLTVELTKDGVVVKTLSGSNLINADGNIKAEFNNVDNGIYKARITVGQKTTESFSNIYVNRIPQDLLDGINAINSAMRQDSSDTTYGNLRGLFSSDQFNSKYASAIGLNKIDYAKLIETTNKYTTEVAKAVYRGLPYETNEANVVNGAFNNAVAAQLRLKQADEAKSQTEKDLQNAKIALTTALDSAMESDRIRWKANETDYTKASWLEYAMAVQNAIKIEKNANSNLLAIKNATDALNNAETKLANGYEVTINITKDDAAWDGAGEITLKKRDFVGSLVGNIQTQKTGLGTIKTERLENAEYEIFVNGKDSGQKIIITNATSSAKLSYFTFNFTLKGTPAINVSSSKVILKEINTKVNTTNNIKSGDAILSGNNVEIELTPVTANGVTGVTIADLIYKWSGKDDILTQNINKVTGYNVSNKLDIVCDVTLKNPQIFAVSTKSDTTGKIAVTGKIDCKTAASNVNAELLENGASLTPAVVKRGIVINEDGSFATELDAPKSGSYSVKVSSAEIEKISNNFTVTKS